MTMMILFESDRLYSSMDHGVLLFKISNVIHYFIIPNL